MTIAAVIPLFNKQHGISAAIDSVLGQTSPADEIIVVDDASTDDGVAIVAGYDDPRIRLLRRDAPGAGGYAARNMAISASGAEWIAFLDADDVWRSDHLQTVHEQMTAWPTAGCVATSYTHVFDERREPQRLAGALLGHGEGGGLLDFEGFLAAWLAARDCPLWTGAVAIRRSVLMQSGGFPAGSALRGGDKDLWLRVARATTIAFSTRTTADFHRDGADKLTDRVDTRQLPCLVATARALAATGTAQERRLLHGLVNQEIELYARWTARYGGRPLFAIGDLAWPPRPAALATLLAARHLPKAWLRVAYRAEHRRRAWSRAQ